MAYNNYGTTSQHTSMMNGGDPNEAKVYEEIQNMQKQIQHKDSL